MIKISDEMKQSVPDGLSSAPGFEKDGDSTRMKFDSVQFSSSTGEVRFFYGGEFVYSFTPDNFEPGMSITIGPIKGGMQVIVAPQ